jgi:phenylacetate-CoA ligase
MGDMVSKGNSESNYVFDSVDGRLDDVIVTPEGKKVGRMDPAFKGVDGIVLSQIVQHKVDSISVYVVLDKNKPGLFDQSLLISNIKSRTSDQINVDIIVTEGIEKGANGKLRAVISKIEKQ